MINFIVLIAFEKEHYSVEVATVFSLLLINAIFPARHSTVHYSLPFHHLPYCLGENRCSWLLSNEKEGQKGGSASHVRLANSSCHDCCLTTAIS